MSNSLLSPTRAKVTYGKKPSSPLVSSPVKLFRDPQFLSLQFDPFSDDTETAEMKESRAESQEKSIIARPPKIASDPLGRKAIEKPKQVPKESKEQKVEAPPSERPAAKKSVSLKRKTPLEISPERLPKESLESRAEKTEEDSQVPRPIAKARKSKETPMAYLPKNQAATLSSKKTFDPEEVFGLASDLPTPSLPATAKISARSLLGSSKTRKFSASDSFFGVKFENDLPKRRKTESQEVNPVAPQRAFSKSPPSQPPRTRPVTTSPPNNNHHQHHNATTTTSTTAKAAASTTTKSPPGATRKTPISKPKAGHFKNQAEMLAFLHGDDGKENAEEEEEIKEPAESAQPTLRRKETPSSSQSQSQSQSQPQSQSQSLPQLHHSPPQSLPRSQSYNPPPLKKNLSDGTSNISRLQRRPTPEFFSSKKAAPEPVTMEKIRSFDEIQELGANRQFFDDFDYLMNGFDVSENNIFLAWDSCEQLVSKCATEPFMHSVKSHSLVTRIYNALYRPPKDPVFRLSLLFFIRSLSRGRDIESFVHEKDFFLVLQEEFGREPENDAPPAKDAVQILLKITNCFKASKYVSGSEPDLRRAVALDILVSVSSPQLTLAPRIRSQLRQHSILDLLVARVSSFTRPTTPQSKARGNKGPAAFDPISSPGSLQTLEKLLKVTENTSYAAPENQARFVGEPGFLATIIGLMNTGDKQPLNAEYTDFIFTVFRVLVNLTNGQQIAATAIGESPESMQTVLKAVLVTPLQAEESLRFDWQILGLALLVNLVEKNPPNREKVRTTTLEKESALARLVKLYNALLQKAESQSEITKKSTQDVVIAAYAALLLGCLTIDNAENRKIVLTVKNGVKGLVEMLEAFLSFNDAAGLKSAMTRDSFLDIIRLLKAFL